MSGSQKFVLLLLALALCFVVGTGLYSSWFNAASVAVFICLMIYFTRPLLMPAGYGANKIRALGLVLGFGIIGSGSSALNTLLPTIWTLPVLQNAPAWLKNIQLISQPSPWILASVVIIVGIVFFCLRDRSVGGGHPTPLKKDFPEDRFARKLEVFCNMLQQDLTSIDVSSNWSPEYYTELEAEVEIRKAKGLASRKKILGLQDAIRKDRTSRSFLILGAPGSGKSVALRKLARDMLAEVKKTHRVPIYINLREWVPDSIVTGGRKEFSVEDLEAFVIKNLVRRGDAYTRDFVNDYFHDLWRTGRLFFIFDSFDEISELLDASENSTVIDSLSTVISRFITTQTASRGVLASRVFRQPTRAFLADKVLEIRPLSEAGISEALSRYPQFTDQVRNTLFSHRLDLIPLVRNPFMMALLGEWIAVNETLPVNQAEIYKNYIDSRIQLCKQDLCDTGISSREVIEVATDIAWFVFRSSTFGLEAPVKVIRSYFNSEHVDTVLELLRFARIARVTPGDEKSFAFVHRRFLEYFVTPRFLPQPAEVPDSHIPTDSRGRDALVLYAQLCSEAEAKRLAELCWGEIQHHFADAGQRIRAIHCLRFLIDAFGSRREVLQPFEEELSAFVIQHVKTGDNILLAKICLEATGLLSESRAAPVLTTAIAGEDGWLQETAFRACRHLPKMNDELEEGMKKYVLNISETNFWRGRKNILLSLSLSDALSGVYRVAKMRLWSMKAALISTLLLAIALPFITLFSVSYAMAVTAPILLFGKAGRTAQTEKAKKTGSDSPAPRAAASFIDKGFISGTFVLFRVMSFVILLVVSIAGLFSPALSLAAIPFYTYSGYAIYNGWLAAANVVLGLMLLDWVAICRFVRSKIHDLLNPKKWLAALSVLAASAAGVGIIFSLIHYISRYPMAEPVFKATFSVLIALMAAYVVFTFIQAVRGGIKDLRRLRKLAFGSVIKRAQIAKIMAECVSDYGRLQFVLRLESEGISATGHWPEGFKLAVGLGEAYTALARLEERWLNLDR